MGITTHCVFRPQICISNAFDSSSNSSHVMSSFMYVCMRVFDFADFAKCLEYRDGNYGVNLICRFRVFETEH